MCGQFLLSLDCWTGRGSQVSASRNVTACARCAELLTILLRTGLQGLNVVQLAQKLLVEQKGWAGLQRLSFEELCKIQSRSTADTTVWYTDLRKEFYRLESVMLQVGEQVPDMTLQDDEGRAVRLRDLKTRYILYVYSADDTPG